jgi:hypothetical protein
MATRKKPIQNLENVERRSKVKKTKRAQFRFLAANWHFLLFFHDFGFYSVGHDLLSSLLFDHDFHCQNMRMKMRTKGGPHYQAEVNCQEKLRHEKMMASKKKKRNNKKKEKEGTEESEGSWVSPENENVEALPIAY